MNDPAHRTPWLLVILLYATGLLAAAQFGKIALTLGALAEAYPDAGGALPILVSLIGLTGIVFGATAGVLAGRAGFHRVLVGALILGGVLSLMQALLPPFPVMVLLRVLEGVSHLSIVVVAPTLMSNVAVPRDKPVVMGLWGTFFGVGFAVLALVVPGLLALGGPPPVLALHGVALLVLAAVLWPMLPVIPVREDRAGFIARHVEIYRDMRKILPGLGFVCHTVQFLALLTFLPAFLPAGAAVVLPLAALLGTFGTGFLARRWSAVGIARGAYLASATGLACMAVVPPGLLFPVTLITFVVIGMVPGACFAAVPELNQGPDAQARSQGALAQIGNMGTTLSAPVFALVLFAGVPGLAGLAVGMSLLGAAILTVGIARIR